MDFPPILLSVESSACDRLLEISKIRDIFMKHKKDWLEYIKDAIQSQRRIRSKEGAVILTNDRENICSLVMLYAPSNSLIVRQMMEILTTDPQPSRGRIIHDQIKELEISASQNKLATVPEKVAFLLFCRAVEEDRRYLFFSY
jgi:hypothetical protein